MKIIPGVQKTSGWTANSQRVYFKKISTGGAGIWALDTSNKIFYK